MNQQQTQLLQQLVSLLTQTNEKIDLLQEQILYLNFGMAFFVGVFACAYLFSYLKDVFSQ